MEIDATCKEMWESRSEDWINRKQDDNYRKYLVRPHLKKHLPKSPQMVVDLGCGDGRETQWLFHETNAKLTIGVDRNPDLVGTAIRNYYGWRDYSRYVLADSAEIKNESSLTNSVDLITTLFVLHDTQNFTDIIESIHHVLRPGGKSITVLVNPQFTEKMLEKGIPVISRTDEEIFCQYPIVEEGSEPFYLPHFHRQLSTYMKSFEDEGMLLSDVELLQPPMTRPFSYVGRHSPFKYHKHNIYWPEINELPSSVIMVHRKG